jgi:glycerol-3-phosphate cytidylyltransferase
MTQQINIRFLSDEYLNRDFTGKQWCIDAGIEIHYHKRSHSYSSSELRDRTVRLENNKVNHNNSELPQYATELIKDKK